ncbi:hypothetical protein HWV62_39670 [Athelia sp. TMB]|nr:hypothetical protein HWV62_39670 [Athelia sp. TMB]
MAGFKELARRRRRRVDKKARKTSRLWAEGCRESILAPHVAPYADALSRSWVAERDYVARVQNEYHQLISWRLADNEEPPLPLPKYDPKLPAPREELSHEEQELKSHTIAKKNKAIRRWLKYRARKLTKLAMSPDTNPEQNPFAALLAQLSGIAKPPQRARQGWQQFMHERNDDVVGPAVNAAWQAKQAEGLRSSDKNNMSYRADIARTIYNNLSSDEQAMYMNNARKDKDAAIAAYKLAVERALCKDNRSPAQRQTCLDNVAAFMAPIMHGLKDMTGYHWVLLGGGPTPRLDGEIGTVHLNAGFNQSHTPMYWRQWDEGRFDQNVISFFKEYLETSFGPDDIAGAALSPASLDDAPYKLHSVPSGRHSDGDSDSGSSDSSSSSDSNSSVDSDLPSPARKKKKKPVSRKPTKQKENVAGGSSAKRKRAGSDALAASKKSKLTAAINKSSPQTLGSDGRAAQPIPCTNDHDLERERNIARNKAMLESLNIQGSLDDLFQTVPQPAVPQPAVPQPAATQPPRPKPRRKAKVQEAAAARRSSRLSSQPPTEVAAIDEGASSISQDTQKAASVTESGGLVLVNDGAQQSDDTAGGVVSCMEDVVHGAERTPVAVVRATPPPPSPLSIAAPSTGAQPPLPSPSVTAPSTSPQPRSAASAAQPESSISPMAAVTDAAPPVPSRAVDVAPPVPARPIDASLPAPPHAALSFAPEKRYIPSAAVKASWLGAPLLQISGQSIGDGYLHVLDLLCKVEASYKFKKLTTSFQRADGKKVLNKPQELADWVRDGRGRRLKPLVKDAEVMEKAWWDYWLAIQPTWRGIARPLATTPYSDLPPGLDCWDPLTCPGPNGLLGVVMCLYWWGCTAKGITPDIAEDKRGTVEGWESAVTEVTYVLQGILHASG